MTQRSVCKAALSSGRTVLPVMVQGRLWRRCRTAEAMEADREKCLALGMDDYVSKPVRVGEMIAVPERSSIKRR